MNYNDNNRLTTEANPEDRPRGYDFNKGDERYRDTDTATTRYREREKARGPQTMRLSSPATLEGQPLWLIQDAE